MKLIRTLKATKLLSFHYIINTELLKDFPLCVLPVCTVPPGPVTVSENNTADVQLVEITSGGDVTLTVTINPDSLFYLKGNALMVKKGLDYEASPGIFPKHQSIYPFERDVRVKQLFRFLLHD